MENIIQNLRAIYNRLTNRQRIGIGLVILGSLIGLMVIAYWSQRTEYGLLFGNLSETAASEVVTILNTENIKYELKEGGKSIYVPKDQVYDLRLRFAGEGIVSDGTSGYEIFDRNTLGMTDFMQKLNLKRALEGELARTISDIEQIETARVHLVIPERSPFRETQAPATASVVVDLKGGSTLSLAHIEGMVALVAGAVEGLESNDVNILDTNGALLSDPNNGDTDTRLTTNQLRLQTEKEAYLEDKAQSLLDQMLGAGNSIIRVNLELDFSRSVKENNIIDPESQTVIAEERLQEEGDLDNASSSVKNYEVSRSVETVEKSVGDISYLSVSVILNYKEQTDANPAGDGAMADRFAPYSDGELAELEALVKEAVGWRTERGDGFAISQILFDTTAEDRIARDMMAQRRQQRIEMFVRYGLMLLALGLATWLILAASKRARESVDATRKNVLQETLTAKGAARQNPAQLNAGQETRDNDLILVDDYYTSKLSPETKARLKAKQLMLQNLKDQVMDNPKNAANLLRTWLSSDLVNENVKEPVA